MLNYLKLLSYVPNFKSPTEATTDFELACINALQKVWPAILVFLCWFHFVQNLWKNIQLKKLKKDNVKDGIVHKLFMSIKFLPFVLITDVISAFKKIKQFAADSKLQNLSQCSYVSKDFTLVNLFVVVIQCDVFPYIQLKCEML